MKTSHQYTARWGTDGGTGIALGETHTLTGKTIDIGCLDQFLAIAAQIAVTQIVCEDEQNIRLIVG